MKLITTFAFTIILFFSYSQLRDSASIAQIRTFQNELNTHYRDKDNSPLLKKDRKKFKGHTFFKINLEYKVTATLKLTPESDTFGMLTSTDRKPLYRQYGIANFVIQGVKCQLSIYQNIKYSQIEGYENSLFLLFNDQTNGKKSYGGGRYIDLEMSEGNEIVIDFNQAYNPYCHYNSKYSCPIPPAENNLPIAIKAGVKVYKKIKSH